MQTLEDMKAAVAEYHRDWLIEADLRFHRIICVASTNPDFVSLFDFLGPHPSRRRTGTRRRSPRGLADAQREQEMIFFAINTRNAEAAHAAAPSTPSIRWSGSQPTPTTYAARRRRSGEASAEAGSGDRSRGRSRGVDVRTPVADDVVELAPRPRRLCGRDEQVGDD